jgi:YD repeat-containing protein
VFEYERTGESVDGQPILATRVTLKNAARLELAHDEAGHAIERTLWVDAAGLDEVDRNGATGGLVSLTTGARFNRHGELVHRVDPAGGIAEWTYDEDNPELRARGNLLRESGRPAHGVAADQAELVTTYEHEPRFQRRSAITDPRGNSVRFDYDERGNLVAKRYDPVRILQLSTEPAERGERTEELTERFEYNAGGQLVRVLDARGAVTEYAYFPEDDPFGLSGGASSADSAARGGVLAHITRDAAAGRPDLPGQAVELRTGLTYDARGNVVAIIDGRGNPTRMRFDNQDRLVEVVSREPFGYRRGLRYDANGSPVEARLAFEAGSVDRGIGSVARRELELIERVQRDAIGAVVRTEVGAGELTVIETLERDAAGNVVRRTDTLGTRTEYRHDERNLLVERRQAAGTAEEAVTTYAYSRSGRHRRRVDPIGATVRYEYDGFERYRGFRNDGGTSKRQMFDAAGNVTRIEVADERVLLATDFEYDELNRQVRIDRAWLDERGEPAGASAWDGRGGWPAS